MTAVYFVIAAVALAGAVALLWLDRRRVAGVRKERAVWGDGHGFTYVAAEDSSADGVPALRRELTRATMDIGDHVEICDIVFGRHYGDQAVAFDLAETATIVAIRRSIASPVVIDVRQEKVLAPTDDDLELLGAMGRRVMFSTHLDIARRVCDRRMVALATNAPDFIEILWNEGHWSVASMALTNDPVRLDTALETVRRFTDLLRVLPPTVDPAPRPDPRDPSSPTGRARRGLVEQKTESIGREKIREPAATGERSMRTTRPPVPPAAPDSGRRMQPMPVRRRPDRGPTED
ncbi:hypothetical protein [Williamsia sp. CHRR-6]|uniref:hypothetical protein n=1 Tax=Williamsia sp. CHRR-6 TaxID=2835871 RepID=UPI001BD941C9|nr:hypothetical protein [Williamsia sp. CHRR-6]MBT0566213.1 hypothetical protein [Williamsia sp. CHRR-6]